MFLGIITVTRNNLAGLKRTHESLNQQVCRDFEWLVIDGASTDGTPEYLNNLSSPSHCVGVGMGLLKYISEPDTGIYDAMNKGIERASGRYLLFLNAGDILSTPDVLEKLKSSISDEDFIYGDSLESGHYKKAASHNNIKFRMFTHHQSMLYRRDPVGDLRYDTRYKIAADYKFTAEFIQRSKDFLYCPIALCDFEPGGISQQQVTQGRREQFRIRRDLGLCSLPVNVGIYGLQTLVMALRKGFPWLYWQLKNF